MNRGAQQARNPQAAAKQKADMIQRQINQGTANMISALCYVTGIMVLIVPLNKNWRKDPIIAYNKAHARILWLGIIICACSIIGSPVAVLLYLGGFYLASEAIAGRRPMAPFLTRFVTSRGMTNPKPD
jgi:hypothetical protein